MSFIKAFCVDFSVKKSIIETYYTGTIIFIRGTFS